MGKVWGTLPTLLRSYCNFATKLVPPPGIDSKVALSTGTPSPYVRLNNMFEVTRCVWCVWKGVYVCVCVVYVCVQPYSRAPTLKHPKCEGLGMRLILPVSESLRINHFQTLHPPPHPSTPFTLNPIPFKPFTLHPI